MEEEIFELRLQGYCCSQIIMALGLKRLNKENPDLIAAMAGLCNGVWQGKTCGIFSASICLLYLVDPEGADRFNISAFSEWFESSFENIDCVTLLEDNPANRIEKCPTMLEASFMKICELLEWDD